MILDTDALIRSAISREMGFEFEVEIGEKKITVRATNSPCKASCSHNGVMDDKAVNKLVKTCLRLRKAHDKWEDKQMADKTLLVEAGKEDEWND